MGPSAFLTELWSDTPPGFVQVWDLPDRKRTRYLQSPVNHDDSLAGRPDVYCAVGLSARRRHHDQRTKAAQVCAIAGLWLDIDLSEPGKPSGAPSLQAAIELAHAILEPTLLVHTGGGVHAWHLLDEGPWRFASRGQQQQAAEMAAQWQALHRKVATDHGWGLDATHDLARVMRLPGTVNAKRPGDPRPVQVIDPDGHPVGEDGHDGPRHSLELLSATCRKAGPVRVSLTSTGAGDVNVAPVRGVDDQVAALLDALRENSDSFEDAWAHRGGPHTAHWSMSEWDLAVLSYATQAGLDDQELAAVITAHRVAYDPADRKHLRPDYLARTIGIARQGQRAREQRGGAVAA